MPEYNVDVGCSGRCGSRRAGSPGERDLSLKSIRDMTDEEVEALLHDWNA